MSTPKKTHLPNRGEEANLPRKVDMLADIVCIPCGCESGYGRPPSVAECSCECHDTARLWWQMKPYRLEASEPGT